IRAVTTTHSTGQPPPEMSKLVRHTTRSSRLSSSGEHRTERLSGCTLLTCIDLFGLNGNSMSLMVRWISHMRAIGQQTPDRVATTTGGNCGLGSTSVVLEHRIDRGHGPAKFMLIAAVDGVTARQSTS